MVDPKTTLIINVIAAILTTSSFLPQAIKTIKTKDTSGISMLMYLMFVTGVFFWGIFGIMINNYPIIIANVVTFIFAGTALVIKIKNSIKNFDKESIFVYRIFLKK
jgi:MtN3 and saliva related transmembrane protein